MRSCSVEFCFVLQFSCIPVCVKRVYLTLSLVVTGSKSVLINPRSSVMAVAGPRKHAVIDCVAIFYKEGKGGENYCNKSKFRYQIDKEEKRLVKFKESIWYVVNLELKPNRPWNSWNSNMERSVKARRREFPL